MADCAGRLAPTWSEGPEPRPMLTGPVPRLAEVSWLGEGAQVTDRDPCPGRPRRARASRRADEAPGVSHHRPAGGWDGPGGAAVAPVAGGAWLPRGGRRSCTPSHGPGFLDIDAFRQLAGCVMRAACPRRLAPRGEGMAAAPYPGAAEQGHRPLNRGRLALRVGRSGPTSAGGSRALPGLAAAGRHPANQVPAGLAPQRPGVGP